MAPQMQRRFKIFVMVPAALFWRDASLYILAENVLTGIHVYPDSRTGRLLLYNPYFVFFGLITLYHQWLVVPF